MTDKKFFIEGLPFTIQFFFQEDKSIRYEIRNELSMKTYTIGEVKWKKST